MIIELREKDTKPPIKAQLLNSDNTPVVLTGATVRLIVTYWDFTPKFNTACTVTNAANGDVEYARVSGDFDPPARYRGEFEITFGDGSKMSVPNDGYIEFHSLKELG